MPLEARKIINSTYGLTFAYVVTRLMPERLGRRVASLIADFLSSRKDWKIVRAVRCNQWVVHGEQLDGSALDQVVHANIHSIAGSIFDLYHDMYDPSAFLRMIEPDPAAIQLVQRPEFAERGLVIAGVHLSNFDSIFHLTGTAGLQAIALTLPELSAGYQKQFELRAKKGIRILQASLGNIKRTVEHLKKGGLVITGIDRPDDSYIYRPKFFGHPAAVPIHHIFLALKANVPVQVVAIIKRPDEKYHLLFSEPIEMQPHPDKHTEILLNAETVLRQAERFIQADPIQWSMTFPVWPDLMAQRFGN